MASRPVSAAPASVESLGRDARLAALAGEGDSGLSIPKWLMVLAARGEVTLRVAVDLEDDPPVSDLDDTASRD